MNKIPTFFKVNFITYSVFYLVKTFVIFEFTNPFWWVVKLPYYDCDTRAGILIGLFFYYIIIYAISVDINDKKKTSKK